MKLVIQPVQRGEAEDISTRLRWVDQREVLTASGLPASELLPKAVPLCSECFTVRKTPSSSPLSIFGVNDDQDRPGVGIVWMLSTDQIATVRAALFREAPKWIDRWGQMYPRGLHNIVDARNVLSIRWLALLGFQFGEQIERGGFPFIHFHRGFTCATP